MALNIPATPELANFANQYQAGQTALLNKQNQEQEGLFGQYQQAIGGQEKLPALYTRLQSEAGIPQLQEQRNTFNTQISGVKNMLDQLDQNVTSRTQGTITTEAQRQRMLASEGSDLNNQLGRLGAGLQPVADLYNQASQNVGNLLGLQQQQNQIELQPLEMRINSLSDRFAREMTGYDNGQQTQLSGILDKLQRDRALSDREWQQAADLAKQEKAYAQQKQLVLTQMQGAGKTASSPQIGTPANTVSPSLQNRYNALKTMSTGLTNNNPDSQGMFKALIQHAYGGDASAKETLQMFYQIRGAKPIPNAENFLRA